MIRLMAIVLQLSEHPSTNGRMPERRLEIQQCLLTNHFTEETYRQTIQPRGSRLLAVDLHSCHLQKCKSQDAAMKIGYWSSANDLQ